jgi:sugar/nucleoside kinase (ribokinase family)
MNGHRVSPPGRVVTIGAHILDVLGWPVEEIPPGQGSVRLRQIKATAAGTAAGTAVNLAKLGADVLTIGAIGDDLLGDMLIEAMRRHGVDTSPVVRKPGVQTSATILPIRPNGERPALHVPGASRFLTLDDIDLDHLEDARALMVGAPDALGDFTGNGLLDVVAAAKGGDALVAVDVLHPGRPADLDRLSSLLGMADWFLPNVEQLSALTDTSDVYLGIKKILNFGTGGVAVTLGADGCLVAWPGTDPVHLRAIPVEVVDTTGCGDAFNAGMITGLLLGASPVDAASLGIACGSLVATGLGSDAGLTGLAQALDHLRTGAPASAARLRSFQDRQRSTT